MVQVPQQVPDLEEAEEQQTRRGPRIAVVAASGAIWVTMAIVGVTVLRPELAMVRRMAMRAASEAPFISAQDFALAPTLPSPASSASDGAAQPPAGWQRYADPAGFTINLPDGWTRTYRSANQVRFTNPSQRGAAIVIAYTATPTSDQYTDWVEQSTGKAGSDPSYVLLGIHRVYYRGYNCADWEFLENVHGVRTHSLDHGFISSPGKQAYAIELVSPADAWSSLKHAYWDELLTSFVPAGTGGSVAPTIPGIRTSPGTSATDRTPGAHTAAKTPATRSTPKPSPGRRATLPPTPTSLPTSLPTSIPTSVPTTFPTPVPTSLPTSIPTSLPTSLPSSLPTGTGAPTSLSSLP